MPNRDWEFINALQRCHFLSSLLMYLLWPIEHIFTDAGVDINLRDLPIRLVPAMIESRVAVMSCENFPEQIQHKDQGSCEIGLEEGFCIWRTTNGLSSLN
jgi:hypothetical protein